MATIALYQFEECPFCAKVRATMEKLGLQYKKVNVPQDRNDPLRKKLLKESGVPTVPVLEIDGKFIGESGIIIKYVKERFSKK